VCIPQGVIGESELEGAAKEFALKQVRDSC